MKIDLKMTDVFAKTNEEVLKNYNFIKEDVKNLGIKKPRVLISLDSGIAYIMEMEKK